MELSFFFNFILKPEAFKLRLIRAFNLKAELNRKCDCHRLLRVKLRTVTLINRGGRTEETPGINGTREKKSIRHGI